MAASRTSSKKNYRSGRKGKTSVVIYKLFICMCGCALQTYAMFTLTKTSPSSHDWVMHVGILCFFSKSTMIPQSMLHYLNQIDQSPLIEKQTNIYWEQNLPSYLKLKKKI